MENRDVPEDGPQVPALGSLEIFAGAGHTGKALSRPKGVRLPHLGSRVRRWHKGSLVQGLLRKPDKVPCKVWKVW